MSQTTMARKAWSCKALITLLSCSAAILGLALALAACGGASSGGDRLSARPDGGDSMLSAGDWSSAMGDGSSPRPPELLTDDGGAGDGLHQASSLSWGAPVTVDSRSGTVYQGNTNSLAIVNGNPAIAYAVQYSQLHPYAICYARASKPDGSSWSSRKALATFVAYFPPRWPSLAVVNGNPAVCYRGSGLKFTRATDANGSKWGSPITIDPEYTDNSYIQKLAYINGLPAVAYTINRSVRFVCATNANGTAWSAPVVLDSGAQFSWPLMLAVNGKPAVCYTVHGTDADPTVYEMRYIRALDANGAAWGSPQAAVADYDAGSSYPIPYRSSMAIVAGNPAICFSKAYVSDGSYSDQCFIRATDADGSAWGTEMTLVDAGGSSNTGSASSGALAVVNGIPTVVYRQRIGDTVYGVNSMRSIQATAADGSAWGATQLVAAVNPTNPCLVPLPGGGAGVAYHDINLEIESFILGQ